MKRTLKFGLGNANTNKKLQLLEFHKEYCSGVDQYLSVLTKEHKYILTNQEVKRINKTLPEGIKQCAYNKAVKIWKSWRRNKRGDQSPTYNGCIDLDKRFIVIEKAKVSFDYVARISTLNKGKRAIIPFNSYTYANQYWDNWELCKGGKIKFVGNNIFLILTFEKEEPEKKANGKNIGIDIGIKKLLVTSEGREYGKNIEKLIDKIQRKKQKSKAFYRALKERDYYINKTVKELPFKETKTIVMENIKNIKKDIKKDRKLRKRFRSKLSRWTYPKILNKVRDLSELNGVDRKSVV